MTDKTPIPIPERGYVHPEVLVSTDWVAQHLDDPDVRIIESDEDLLLYSMGHIPGAVRVDWISDLNDPITRDYIDRQKLEDFLLQPLVVQWVHHSRQEFEDQSR